MVVEEKERKLRFSGGFRRFTIILSGLGADGLRCSIDKLGIDLIVEAVGHSLIAMR